MTAWLDKEFIFACGLHRSGTSLLFQILREHPEISGFSGTDSPEDEGQHLQSVYPTAKVFGGPGKFALNPDSYMDETSSIASPEHAEQLYGEWAPLWDTSRRYLLEKSPPTLVRTRYFQALYPRSRFVVLLRHPLAVSLATRKWNHTSFKELIKHWLVAHERFEADRAQLGHVLYYKHLIQRPNEVLEELYAFLGLESMPNEVKVNDTINDKYFEQWEARRAKLGFRLKHAAFLRRMEPRANRFGYSLLDYRRMPTVN
jgi:hypothetical protein|tara:strand:- start:609 stop:1382 length:774 start_codon:yes stop_codon:yes gene_type:complete